MTRQTIVVVEDEPAQRIGAAAMFADHGFDTAEFENADEAGAYVRQNEDKVLAVFTDVRMPGDTDGVNLAAQIAVTCPTITLLVTSGRSEGVLERLPPNGFFVPKPWSATDLDQAIDHIRRRQQ